MSLQHALWSPLLNSLPGQRLQFLSRPRAVVVFLVLQALIFLDTEQDECLLSPGVDDARRIGLGVRQRLNLLFGEFDHGGLLSRIIPAAYPTDKRGE